MSGLGDPTSLPDIVRVSSFTTRFREITILVPPVKGTSRAVLLFHISIMFIAVSNEMQEYSMAEEKRFLFCV